MDYTKNLDSSTISKYTTSVYKIDDYNNQLKATYSQRPVRTQSKNVNMVNLEVREQMEKVEKINRNILQIEKKRHGADQNLKEKINQVQDKIRR